VSSDRKGKHDYSKKHACVFCGKLDLKISRHLEKCKSGEKVIEILPKASRNKNSESQKKREHILNSLRNEGDFMYNVDVLKHIRQGKQQCTDELIVARRPDKGKHQACDYLPCKFCLKFYIKSDLWRHCKNCTYSESPLSHTEKEPTKESKSFISTGQKLLQGAGVMICQYDDLETRVDFHTYIIDSLANDELGKIVRNDVSIVDYGKGQFEKLGKHRASGVRYRMRLLARIKVKLLQDKPVGDGPELASYLRPENFNSVVHAVKQVVGVSEERSLNGVIMFNKPEVAKKTGHVLKKLGEMYRGRMLMERKRKEKENVSDFIKLYESTWSDRIGSVAHQTARERQFNTKEVLPATDDIMILQAYQDEQIKENMKLLSKETSMNNWKELAYFVLSKVQTFNFRRGNETAKMQLKKYLDRANWKEGNMEIYNSLDKLEKELAKRLVPTKYFTKVLVVRL